MEDHLLVFQLNSGAGTGNRISMELQQHRIGSEIESGLTFVRELAKRGNREFHRIKVPVAGRKRLSKAQVCALMGDHV